MLEGMVLKPNMVIAGKKSAKKASPEEVAEKTVKCLKDCVPATVAGHRVPLRRPIGRGSDDPSRC